MVMAAWRRIAMELFPELRREFNSSRWWDRWDRDYHNFFASLSHSFRDAFDAGEEDQLARIFAFAEWCLSQEHRATDLHQTIRQSFYGYVFDVKRRDWPDVARWLSRRAVATCRPDWERRMNDEDRAKLAKVLKGLDPVDRPIAR